MEKRLSTLMDTERGSQSYMEKSRGSKEIEVGGVKRRETDLASSQFPKCSPQPRIPKEIQSWEEKRRGR